MANVTLDIDLNRVEGDLEFQVELDGNKVVDARCIGTMFRGFEQLLIDRAPTDSLVITPRICGICGTAHLYTATLALERMAQLPVPAHATLIRNLCLMAENVQSDLRQHFLFFAPDLLNARYASHSMFDELTLAYRPLQGEEVRSAMQASRKLLEIVAIFGGQWPHSSYMTPGGVTRGANSRDIVDCQDIVDNTIRWYEQVVIGDTLDNWLSLADAASFDAWLDDAKHAKSAIGKLTQFCRDQSIHLSGGGANYFMSAGAHYDIRTWQPPYGPQYTLLPAGVYNGNSGINEAFDPALINEHVRHSWYRPYDGGLHPYQGETVPDYDTNGDRYTWAKAPRYGDKVIETGPLAELLAGEDTLTRALLARDGANTLLRQLARLRRAGVLLSLMKKTLQDLAVEMSSPHYQAPPAGSLDNGEGFGFVQAARGTLGHWVQVQDGKISRYQVITPTAWNASPKDTQGVHGHWEESVIGLELADLDNPIEIGHVIRSHDPCLVCTVHFAGRSQRLRIGA